jgi:hypothetical protein|nr:MAG TPA: hypothetical protein [Herelleviridae sp.]
MATKITFPRTAEATEVSDAEYTLCADGVKTPVFLQDNRPAGGKIEICTLIDGAVKYHTARPTMRLACNAAAIVYLEVCRG